ncbi:MAG: hypothetical protein HGA54_00915 [Actinobacteria bacterium]|nr:hypothetical protein [Actinomycetota bacterium]
MGKKIILIALEEELPKLTRAQCRSMADRDPGWALKTVCKYCKENYTHKKAYDPWCPIEWGLQLSVTGMASENQKKLIQDRFPQCKRSGHEL